MAANVVCPPAEQRVNLRSLRAPGWIALGCAVLILALLGAGVAVAFQKGALATSITSIQQVVNSSKGSPTAAAATDVYREAIVGAPTMLNPLLASSQPDRDLSALIFSGLTRTDATGGVVPDLAKSWQVSGDGKTYTFLLRDKVSWQDGQAFTAQDVLFTIRLLQDAAFPGDSGLADFWRSITVETPDDHTVICTLTKPFAPFLAYTSIGIVPQHLLGAIKASDLASEPFNLHPVGTGPFAFASLDTAKVEVVLKRFNDYYGAKPHIRELHFRSYRDAASAIHAAGTGEVDGVSYIPPSLLTDTKTLSDLADMNVYGPSLAGYTALFFNLKQPAFAEQPVRQALAQAVNRDALVKNGLQGWGTAASSNSPILPNSWAYTTQGVPQYTYNPDAAKQALDQAGWKVGASGAREKNGQALAFTILADNDPLHVAVANLLAQELTAVGCKVTVDAKSANDVTQAIAARRFDAALAGWEGLAADPDPYPAWHSSQADTGYNFANYSNPQADEALENGRLTADPAKRKEYYTTFQKLFAADVPSLILYYPQYHFAVSKRVTGVSADPLDEPSDRFRGIANWQFAAP
jgi:peptide/nickel transport system substrate-binding protein